MPRLALAFQGEDLEEGNLVAYRANTAPESLRDVLWLLMAAIGMVLFIYVAAPCVIIEFLYRHLIAPLTRLGRVERR
jgi:hypothetical protein